jgi:hypothetical protein
LADIITFTLRAGLRLVHICAQLEEIRSFQSECSEWLYGDGVDAPAEKTRERLDKLATMTKPIFHRRDGTFRSWMRLCWTEWRFAGICLSTGVAVCTEYLARPGAIEELQKAFERLEKLKDIPEVWAVHLLYAINVAAIDKGMLELKTERLSHDAAASRFVILTFAQSDRHWTEAAEKRVADVVDETRKWLEGKLEEQDKKPLTEDPVFLATELSRKVCGAAPLHG